VGRDLGRGRSLFPDTNLFYWRFCTGGYQEYIADVMNEELKGISLRDKDLYLWGKSLAVQLEKDIKRNFVNPKIPNSKT